MSESKNVDPHIIQLNQTIEHTVIALNKRLLITRLFCLGLSFVLLAVGAITFVVIKNQRVDIRELQHDLESTKQELAIAEQKLVAAKDQGWASEVTKVLTDFLPFGPELFGPNQDSDSKPNRRSDLENDRQLKREAKQLLKKVFERAKKRGQ